MSKFTDWLFDDEYEGMLEIYSDKDKFVLRDYVNTKKGVNRYSLEKDNNTGKIQYKDSNPLLNAIGGLITQKINQKIEHENIKQIEW